MARNATQAYGQSKGIPTRINPSLLPGISKVPHPINTPPTRDLSDCTPVMRTPLNLPAVQPPQAAPVSRASTSTLRPARLFALPIGPGADGADDRRPCKQLATAEHDAIRIDAGGPRIEPH